MFNAMLVRRSWWIILAVLFVAIGTRNARADDIFPIDFTQTSGTDVAPTGSVDYVPSTTPDNGDINVTINWLGNTFVFSFGDLLAGINVGPTACEATGNSGATDVYNFLTGCAGSSISWIATEGTGCPPISDLEGCNPSAPNSEPTFTIYTSEFGYSTVPEFAILEYPVGYVGSSTDPTDSGTFSVSTQVAATPEPEAGSLMLFGIVVVLVVRKRIAQRTPRGSH